MAKKARFTEELKGLLKTLSIRMIEQLSLWQKNPETGKLPTWAEKELTMTKFMSSEEELDKLLNILEDVINKIPEDAVSVGFVTVSFIKGTYELLQSYKEVEFKGVITLPEQDSPKMEEKGV